MLKGCWRVSGRGEPPLADGRPGGPGLPGGPDPGLEKGTPPSIECGSTHLLAWAAHAAEVGLTLLEPVHFLETSLRPYTTAEVGRYCRDQLKYLSLARSNRATGGWGRFTPDWWTEMEDKTIEALAALKAAIEVADGEGESTE